MIILFHLNKTDACIGLKEDHLLVDKMIMTHTKREHKNPLMSWIDLRKAYDSVPHDWTLF